MSLTQPEFLPPRETSADFDEPGRGPRAEDVLRFVVAGILIFAVGLALGGFTFHELAGRGSAYFIVAACFAIIATALAYYRFQPALAVYTAVIWISIGGTPDLAQGVSSGTGKGIYPVELGTIFMLFIWVLRGLGTRRFPVIKTPLNGLLVAYLAFNVWCAVNGWLFWDPALTHFYASLPGGGRTAPQVIVLELAMRFLSVGVFWMMASSLTDLKSLRWASGLILLPGVLIMLSHFHLAPALSNVYDTLMEIVVACALWAWLLENPQGKPGLRVLAFAGLGLLIFQVFFLQLHWISGWIGLFSGLFFVTWLKSKRLFFGLVCLVAVLALLSQPFLKANVVHKVQTSGDLDRFSMQKGALLYAFHFPLGIGPGNFRAYNAYYGSRAVWNTTGYTSAHNFYGQALSEMGFGGLFLTLAWVIAAAVMLTRFYRRSPPGRHRTMILALAGMWAGFSVSSYLGDYLIPVYHNGGLANFATTIYAWIGLGLATAHARMNGALAVVQAPTAPAPPVRASWPTAPRRGAS